MCSVDSIEFLYCYRCKRETAQSTYWDSSRPNDLETHCLEHNRTWYDRKVSVLDNPLQLIPMYSVGGKGAF